MKRRERGTESRRGYGVVEIREEWFLGRNSSEQLQEDGFLKMGSWVGKEVVPYFPGQHHSSGGLG